MPSIPRLPQRIAGAAPQAAALAGSRVRPNADLNPAPSVEGAVSSAAATLGRAGMSVADALSSAGRAQQESADRIQRLALNLSDQAVAEKQEADKTEALKLLTTAKSDMGRQLMEAQSKAPAGAEGFTDGFLERFDTYSDSLLEQAPDSQRDALEQRLSAYRGDLELDSLAFELRSRSQKKVADAEIALGMAVNAVRTDPTSYDDTLAEYRGTLAATDLPAGTAEALDSAAVQELTASYIDGLINADPFSAGRRIKAGEFDDRLSSGDRAQLESRAETEADRIRRKVEAERKAAESRLAGKVESAVRLMQRGETPPDLGGLVNEAEGTELHAPLLAAVEDLSSLQAFTRLTPVERSMRLADERRALDANLDPTSEAELRRLDRFESMAKIDQRLREAAGKDALSTAAQQGIVSLAPVDFNDVDTIRARVRQSDVATQQTGTRALPFTAGELDSLASQIEGMNADQRAELAGNLRAGLGSDRMVPVLSALGQKGPTLRTFAVAGALEQQSPHDAKLVLQGMDALAAEENFGPTQDRAILREVTNEMTGTALAALPAESYQAVMESATAWYAAQKRASGDSTGAFDERLWQQAVNAMTGGFVDWGGRRTVAPRRGMSQPEFDDLMAGLRDEDLGREPPRTELSGEVVDATTIRDEGALTAIGQGRYRVTIRGYTVTDGGGRPYVLDLRDVPIRAVTFPEGIPGGTVVP